MTRRATLALVLWLAAGCSSLKPYEAAGPDNVLVNSALSEVRGALHVHGVEAGCRTEYFGTVHLDRPATALSLPPGRLSYLVFSFDSTSWLAGSRSTSVGRLLEPRAGYRYDVDVTYRESIYNVTLRESAPRDGPTREIVRRGLPDCKDL